jgi:tryptophanyl-tRNA synthetase
VTELSWLLATVTGMGLLERAVSYKDKVTRGLKANVGLFTYPVLMAADILIYDSSIVPVGKDQIQHVEMAQDMATHFNEIYGRGNDLLRRPEFRLSETPYVIGTDGQKMSTSYGNIIPIFGRTKQLRKAVGAIVTDSTPLGQPMSSDGCNVFALLKLFASADELEQIASYYASGRRDGEPFGYGHAKQILAAHIERKFAAANEERERLLAQPDRVQDVLRRSAARAREVARATIERCKRATGLS